MNVRRIRYCVPSTDFKKLDSHARYKKERASVAKRAAGVGTILSSAFRKIFKRNLYRLMEAPSSWLWNNRVQELAHPGEDIVCMCITRPVVRVQTTGTELVLRRRSRPPSERTSGPKYIDYIIHGQLYVQEV